MKKILLLASAFLLIGALFAQKQELAPYLKNPVLPDFKILQKDSATWFTKAKLKSGKPVMIMLFSPDCEHCQLQTNDMLKKMKELGDLQIVMATFQSMEKMRKFDKEYGISAYPNIHMGRDESFFFGPFYASRSIPFLAIYDRNRKLAKVYDGGAPAEKISAALK